MRLPLASAAIALLALGLTSARATELLTNGDFENEPNFGAGFANDPGFSGFTGNQIPGWTIVPGHGVTIHNTVFYPHIDNYSVNLDGEGLNGTNADFFQDIPSIAGQPYTLSYDHLGWVSSSLQTIVSLTDLSNNSVIISNTTPWTPDVVHESLPFLGTGNMLRVEILETPSGFNDNSLIFDNVSVNSVPEPATASVLLLPAAISLMRRRTTR